MISSQPLPKDEATLLVVEDDEATREKMAAYFEKEGYRVLTATTASECNHQMGRNNVDLVILDINLPEGDGLTLAREIRAKLDIGIIFVSGRSEDVDRIIGLEIGADDYMVKPYNPRELLARVKGLLRRTLSGQSKPKAVREFSGWQLDMLRRVLIAADGRIFELTRAELELLDIFTKFPGTMLSRDRLMYKVTHRAWNPGDRTIDVLIRRLRLKLELDPAKPTIIKTVHGEGYMFCDTVVDSINSSAALIDS